MRSRTQAGRPYADAPGFIAGATQKVLLIVEDDDDLRESLCESFTYEGFRCEGARDGWDALEQLRGGLRPAVILIDLKMGRMDGTEFLARRREEDAGIAAIPVIVLTGDNRSIPEAERLGAVAVVKKGASVESLFDAIRPFAGDGSRTAGSSPGRAPAS